MTAEIPSGGEEPIRQRPTEPGKSSEGPEQNKLTEYHVAPSSVTPEVAAPNEVPEYLQGGDTGQAETNMQVPAIESSRPVRRKLRFCSGFHVSSQPEHEKPNDSVS